MAILSINNLFMTSVLLYSTAAAASLFLMKWQKICNLISNIICIAASVFGVISSMMILLSENSQIDIHLLESSFPFISADLRIDNLSAFFLLSMSILVGCVSIYSIGYVSHYIGKRNVGLLNFLYSTFILSMVFVMTASTTVFFFIAWEAMSILSYFLVIFESDQEENLRAGTLYVIMMHVGAALLLIGFMTAFSYTKSFDIYSSSATMPEHTKDLLFILFIIGFGIKAGAIPFHIWLPHAHPAAPSNASALMSGIMIKTAIYGILRFIFDFLGVRHIWWGAIILVIGIVTAVIGVAYAFTEKNIKRLLAYSSIENVGIIFIGLGSGFIAYANGKLMISALAITASLLHSFNHTLFKGALFLGAGSIQYSTHTKNMEKLGGLIKKMPVTSLFILGGALSVSALIPFNGFISEWLTYQSLFATVSIGQAGLNILTILAVAALAISGALAVASFVKFFGISFLGLPRSSQASHAKEVPGVMNVGIGILVSLCLFIGLFPILILIVIDKVIINLMGTSLISQLKGGLLVAFYPIDISGNTISPLVMLIIITGVILIALFLIRVIGGKYIERKYGTWDCGFEALNSRMQYSATGFSKPINIAFKLLFRPSRKIKVTGKNTEYHPESIEYATSSESIFEKYIYNLAFGKIQNIAKKIKYRVQTGNIRNYLLYIFVAILVLMLYNRFA